MAGKNSDNVALPDDNLSGSRARVDELRAKGRVMAAYLRAEKGCFIEQAALHAGINPRTYRRWVDQEGEEYEAFQAEVLPALHDHAKALLEAARLDIESAEGGSSAYVNWHKWLLPKRHPKLFGEQAAESKVEVTGKDGAPLGLQPKELLELYAKARKDAEDGE
jgi:transposase-like protein